MKEIFVFSDYKICKFRLELIVGAAKHQELINILVKQCFSLFGSHERTCQDIKFGIVASGFNHITPAVSSGGKKE